MPTGKEIKQLLKTSDYDFLREDENLGNNICYLTVGGSVGYGTNLPEKQSDIDIRGFCMESKDSISRSLLEMEHFEQCVERNTDTTIYGFHKFIHLLMDCNPNTIELLGTKKDHILYMNDIGKKLRDNSQMFLSKRICKSFGGYAGQQLNRMLNAIARDRLEQREREEHILRSIKSAMYSFNDRYSDFGNGSIEMFIDDSDKLDLDGEIFANIDLKHYPLREFNSILNELGSISRSYNKINHRNHKKDDEHLNKHAMHLVRLYLMGIDLLEKGEIITFREKDQDMLLSIRRGKYMKPDGTYQEEFFSLIEELENHFNEASKTTVLPDRPDYAGISNLVTEIDNQYYRNK